ncbi:MAG: anti-sigma factor antagonist [Chitinivibrionales bacterium]|nr:anti-sigma factor antagonist [Chitinivibrionales bacterium]
MIQKKENSEIEEHRVAKKLSLQLRGNEKSRIIHANGDITSPAVPDLSQMVEEFSESEYRRLIIDLTQVNFVDSYGLGSFVYYHSMLSEKGKTLLFAVHETLKEILTNCNLDKVLNIVDPLELLTDIPVKKKGLRI